MNHEVSVVVAKTVAHHFIFGSHGCCLKLFCLLYHAGRPVLVLSKNYIAHVRAYLSLLSDLLLLIITVQVWKHGTMNTRTLCVWQ